MRPAVRNSLTARTLHFTYASDSTNFGSLGQMALDATLGPVVDMTSCHVDGALFLFIVRSSARSARLAAADDACLLTPP